MKKIYFLVFLMALSFQCALAQNNDNQISCEYFADVSFIIVVIVLCVIAAALLLFKVLGLIDFFNLKRSKKSKTKADGNETK